MKKQRFLLLFFLISSFHCYSQINFEEGYFINNEGKKINCLIKNMEWNNSPTSFEYKIDDSSDKEKANIETVQEFGINDKLKYKRATVLVDLTSNDIDKLTYNRIPDLTEKTIFLKALVEGEASLYLYIKGSLSRYFYTKNNSDPEQLIYKKYKTDQNNIATNYQYKTQLIKNFSCSTIKIDRIGKLRFDKKNLINFFIDYNTCSSADHINYYKKVKHDFFNLTFRPRVNYASLSTSKNFLNPDGSDFDNHLSFGFGIESEFILPFHKKKWAVIIEPSYQRFKGERSRDVFNLSGGKLITEINYKAIDFPLGIRYYTHLNNDSKIFFDVAYFYTFPINSTIENRRADGSLVGSKSTIGNYAKLTLGTGYKFKDKYSMALGYQTLTSNIDGLFSNYKVISIIVGYSIF